MTVQYSVQKMVSDGTLSTIALGIQYLQRNDIYMRIAGEDTPQSGAHSGYTWSFINNTTLKILPVVPNGVEVVVYRRTDIDAMYNIYSQNAQFDEATIDENNQQLLYIAQEYLEQGIPGAGVDTLEFVRDDGTYTYYRIKRTDGSYSDEFAVPSAGSATKIIAREALRRSYAEAGYNLADGSFETGGTLVNANDVLLHEASGKVFSGPAGHVDAGTDPTGGGFVDVSGAVHGLATVAKINSGMYGVGTALAVSDRAGATFLITAGGTPNGTYILDAGNGNTAVYQIPSDGVVNVKALGGKSGVDSSLAVQHACALSTRVHFPDDDVYEISYDVNNGNRSFVTYSNELFIRITGDAATIKDASIFNVGTSYLVDIFKFVNCTDVLVNVNCDATPLPDLTAPSPEGLGYKGSSFVYFEGSCSQVRVYGYHKNVRYGVRSGDYNNPALGGLNDIKVKVKCYQVGYPVALYLAKNIKLDIDSNNQHRAAYLAGCQNVSGRVTQAGFMYDHIGVLVNDSLTAAAVADADRRSYGCDNIHLNVFDRGTTGTQANRAVCGINSQWKAPDIAFNDVHFHIYAYCNNANRTLAGFRLENTVGWMPTNEYNNIKVSGLIDRRAQTLGASSYADFSIDGIESGETGPYPNSPKFNGIDLSELQIINGAVTGNLSKIFTPNAVGVINLRGAKMAGASISTNAPNARIVLTNASVASVTGPGVKFPTKSLGPSGYRVGDDGIIEQWMQVNYTVSAGADQTFTFPTAFFTQAFAPSITANGSATVIATTNGAPSLTRVTVRCNTTGATLFIKALGY